jgi:hypothetical protein
MKFDCEKSNFQNGLTLYVYNEKDLCKIFKFMFCFISDLIKKRQVIQVWISKQIQYKLVGFFVVKFGN